MKQITLIIGNRNYSSWSLRAWLVMQKSGLPFREIQLSLNAPVFEAEIGKYSPSGRVPAILVDEQSIWDSLAISEYLNELVDGRLWPRDAAARAHARSIVAEMHSGFERLRGAMPMNCRAENRRVNVDAELQCDIDRVLAIWKEARSGFGGRGDWLFGEFSIADAFYAPVVLRFMTYGVEADSVARQYMEVVLSDPDLHAWCQKAADESEVLEEEEVGK